MGLDAKDKKLLQVLDLEPKITTLALAKTLRVSQQVADYRLKRLMQDKVITQISALVHLPALGFEQYRLFFRFGAISAEEKKKVIKFLASDPAVFWAARVGGAYDLHVALAVKDYREFDGFLDTLNLKFPRALVDHDALYVVKHLYFSHKFLSESKERKKAEIDCVAEKCKVDEIDLKILHCLKKDARVSSVALGKECDVSYKTVLQRIKKLEEKGVIPGYRLFVTLDDFKPYLLLMRYKNYSHSTEKELLQFIFAEEHFTQAVRQFGSWDLLLHTRAKSLEELQDVIIHLREKYSLVENIEIMPVFEDIAIDLMPCSKWV